MDIHPSGFPGLVGPEGGDFSHFDFSSHFRVLPTNGSADVPSSNHENLILRHHLQSLHLQASPPSNGGPRLSQPLRFCEDGSKKNGSGNGRLERPRPHQSLPFLGSSPEKRLSYSFSSPARLSSEEIGEADGHDALSDGADENGDPCLLGF